jgi:hypothetical protein
MKLRSLDPVPADARQGRAEARPDTRDEEAAVAGQARR